MMKEISKQLADNPSLDLEIRFLAPDEYWRIAPIFEAEGAPLPDARYGKVVVAMDGQKVVGVIVAQMVLHVEPIIVDKDYREQGVWRPMAHMLDGFLAAVGINGAYAQPIYPNTKYICKEMGFREMEHSLYLKIYNPELAKMFPDGEE